LVVLLLWGVSFAAAVKSLLSFTRLVVKALDIDDMVAA